MAFSSSLFCLLYLLMGNLFSRFSPIIVLAQHLTVFGFRFSTLVPWGNMVGFHFLNLKLLFAFYTDTLLPLIRFAPHIVVKRSNREVSFVSGQQVRINT